MEEALALWHGKPDIFNSDQAVPVHQRRLHRRVAAASGVAIRHGRQRAHGGDNVFVDACGEASNTRSSTLRAYDSVSEERSSIGRYLAFYNHRLPHSSSLTGARRTRPTGAHRLSRRRYGGGGPRATPSGYALPPSRPAREIAKDQPRQQST